MVVEWIGHLSLSLSPPKKVDWQRAAVEYTDVVPDLAPASARACLSWPKRDQSIQSRILQSEPFSFTFYSFDPTEQTRAIAYLLASHLLPMI